MCVKKSPWIFIIIKATKSKMKKAFWESASDFIEKSNKTLIQQWGKECVNVWKKWLIMLLEEETNLLDRVSNHTQQIRMPYTEMFSQYSFMCARYEKIYFYNDTALAWKLFIMCEPHISKEPLKIINVKKKMFWLPHPKIIKKNLNRWNERRFTVLLTVNFQTSYAIIITIIILKREGKKPT